jgi:hypothetical protein
VKDLLHAFVRAARVRVPQISAPVAVVEPTNNLRKNLPNKFFMKLLFPGFALLD